MRIFRVSICIKYSSNLRKKEFILACGSRGIDLIVTWKTWSGGRNRTPAGHILSTQKGERERDRGGEGGP